MSKIKCIKGIKSNGKTNMDDYIYTDETAYEKEFEGERYSDLTAEERLQYRILRKSMISFYYGEITVYTSKGESLTDYTDDEMEYLQKWLDNHKLTEDDIVDSVYDEALEFGGYKKYFKKLIKLIKLDQEQAEHIASVMAVYNENRGQMMCGEDSVGFNPNSSDDHQRILNENEIELVDGTESNSVEFTIKPEVRPHQFSVERLNSWIESNREKYKQMILGWLNEERVKLEDINRVAKYKLRFGITDFYRIKYHLTPIIKFIAPVKSKVSMLDVENRKLLNRDGTDVKFNEPVRLKYERINSSTLKDGSSGDYHDINQLFYIMCLDFINNELKSNILKVGWKKSEVILGNLKKDIVPVLKKFVDDFYYDTILNYVLDELDAKAVAQDLDYLNHHKSYMDKVKFYPKNFPNIKYLDEEIVHYQNEFNEYYNTKIELTESEISHLKSLYCREESDKSWTWLEDYTTAHWYFDIYEYLDSKK